MIWSRADSCGMLARGLTVWVYVLLCWRDHGVGGRTHTCCAAVVHKEWHGLKALMNVAWRWVNLCVALPCCGGLSFNVTSTAFACGCGCLMMMYTPYVCLVMQVEVDASTAALPQPFVCRFLVTPTAPTTYCCASTHSCTTLVCCLTHVIFFVCCAQVELA